MATYTTNYNLEKPDASDDFGDFRASYNSNMDIIDQNLGGGGGGGDTVSWTQIQATGEKIAEITINGTTTDVLIPFEAKIIVTTTTGLTVTATKGGTTYTATETSTGVYEVTVDSKGTWTVTDGTNTTTVSVTAQTTYNVAFVVIPDGSTVTPTDDIQTWLNCANIWDKSYTTLAEVLADTTTLSALISSNNAVDYLVRSTTWAIRTGLVPTMTSNTTPSGAVSGSSIYSSAYDYYKAFDVNSSTCWNSLYKSSATGEYIQYQFSSEVIVSKIKLNSSVTAGTAFRSCVFSVQGSNDGSTWETIATITQTATTDQIFDLNNTKSYKYVRILTIGSGNGYLNNCFVAFTEIQFYSASITDNSTAMSYIGLNNYCANKLLADATWRTAICNSTYFESVLNVKVPVMTSNTTPSGECFVDQTASWFEPYYFFDGNTSRHGGWAQNSYPHWFAYDFGRNVKVFGFKWYAYQHYGGKTIPMKLEYSDDKSTWNAYGDTVNAVQAVAWSSMAIMPCSTDHRYWRIYCVTQGTADSIAFGEVQFYGREDV